MKNYEDKILLVLPDEDTKVIIIPQSLKQYIDNLEKDLLKSREDYLKFITIANPMSQQVTCTKHIYMYGG